MRRNGRVGRHENLDPERSGGSSPSIAGGEELPEVSDLAWRKSRFSTANGDCVEIAVQAGGVAVRDSKDKNGHILLFRRDEWQQFIGDMKAGNPMVP